MRTVRRTTALCATLLGLAGCTQDTVGPGPSPARAPGEAPAIEITTPVPTLSGASSGWSGELAFTFTNQSSRTISISNCQRSYSVELQKREGDAWVTAWRPVLPMCLSSPIRLAPGEQLPDRIHVFAGRPGSNSYPQFEVREIPGTYRLVIGGAFWNYDHDGPPWGEAVPLDLRVSAPFEIRVEG